MISTFGISQSGMQAASDQLNVTANNLANVNTNGFKKGVVQQKEAENGGVETNVTTNNEEANQIRTDSGDIVELSNVRMEEEIVNQIVGQNQFSANLAALKTTLETEGEVIDLIT